MKRLGAIVLIALGAAALLRLGYSSNGGDSSPNESPPSTQLDASTSTAERTPAARHVATEGQEVSTSAKGSEHL